MCLLFWINLPHYGTKPKAVALLGLTNQAKKDQDKKDCMTQFPSICLYRDGKMFHNSPNNLIPMATSPSVPSFPGTGSCASFICAQDKVMFSLGL